MNRRLKRNAVISIYSLGVVLLITIKMIRLKLATGDSKQ